MRRYMIVFILLTLWSSGYAQNDNELYTIYLVRHAEKEVAGDSPGDPQLTSCGKQRAVSLAGLLEKVDLATVYSSDYRRTKDTALPTANAKALGIEMYDPRDLGQLAEQLLDQKQDALVVGHSNTTAVLAGLLIGEEFGSFDESIYDRIYQVVICGDQTRLHILQSSFVCQD